VEETLIICRPKIAESSIHSFEKREPSSGVNALWKKHRAKVEAGW
jgi:hypothetical protein